MHKKIRYKNQGVTLIEVLVTMIITSIGLMGLISLQMQALKGTSDAGNRSQAIWLWNDISNRIQANQEFSESYVTPADGVDCSGAITPICNDQNGSATSACTGEQLAAWDKYDVACNGNGNNGVISHPVQYLPGALLTISLPSASSKNLLVELTWRAKADDESITGATRTADSGELEISGLVPR
jgi:type IV pilus assembly protein PilV